MDRRWTGCVVLVVVLLAILTMPRALRVDPLPGDPSAAAMPAPPAVGTCLVLDFAAGTRVTVACDQPHDAEVTAVWTAENPARVSSATAANCARKAQEYTGVDALASIGSWTLPRMVDSRVLVAGVDDRLKSYGWALCVVLAPTGETFVGSLRGPLSIHGFPDALATCSDIVLVSTTDQISCATPHLVQVLGSSWRVLPPGVADVVTPGHLPVLPSNVRSELRAQCFAIAAELTGVADPTYDGRVVIGSDATLFERDLADPTAGKYLAMCTLTSTAGRWGRSLIGNGDAPLPYS